MRLAADRRLGAIGFTGSRSGGLKLKAAADAVGKPIYLELSSINPVVVLPRALKERAAEIVEQFIGSCLAATGQFCTNPGLVILIAGPPTEAFIAAVAERFRAAPVGTLLSSGVADSLAAGVRKVTAAESGIAIVEVVVGSATASGGYSHANTLLRAAGSQFLANSEAMQTEMFGNASLFVVAADVAEAGRVLDSLDGNLTGSFYSDSRGGDDAAYEELGRRLCGSGWAGF